MGIFNISVVLNLYFMVLLQSCRMSYADQARWQSKTIFGVSERTSLEAMLESSATSLLVQGGNKINFNLTVSYRREEVSNKSVAEVESAVESYCQYVEELKKKDIYVGGEIIVNCTNVTKTVDSNYTCNSSDGVSCIFNFTRNSTAFVGNSSYLNETRNVTSYSLIVMKAQRNVTSRLCVNVTTPLVKVDPVVNPPSHFNLSHQNLEIEVELPAQFHIESIENLALSHQFDNITLNCTEYVVNSSYTKNPSKPKIKLQVQFANISWNGSMVVSAMVTERVLPRQFLNVTANVTLSGVTKSLWIGSYTVPGLWFKNMEVKTTSFRETLGNLLTDEEEVVIETSVVIPSVTTNIEAIIALPVFAGSLPVKVISARLSNVQGNIQSSNLRLGSSIGSTIVLREVVPLDPAAPTLVKFDFGRTFNPPGVVNSSVTLQVTGKVDSVGRSDSYVPNSLGNISAWIVYTTAFGQENISSPQWIELELGQPQIKYEINFVKDNGEVEGGDEIGCLFQFFNPAFATEAGDVILDVVFDSQDIMVINSSVAVCNISLDSSSPSHCQNITAWSLLLSITNTNSSFHIQFTK